MIKVKDRTSRELREVMGYVTEIERYAIHDGPGIRSTVFLKGCPLSCAWCSNPETQRFLPELGLFAEKCIGCGACVKACPAGAITVTENGLQTDRSRCYSCSADETEGFPCTQVCYAGSRVTLGKRRTAWDVYSELARDRSFYDSSNGGITISGGEPLAQPDFCYAVLRLCRENWIHTAIETCGAGKIEDYETILPYLDLVFIDVKSVNSEKYRQWTGADIGPSMESLRVLSKRCREMGVQMVARTPVIPGFNDSAEEIAQIAMFLKENGVQAAELLPYHKLGRSKYVTIGREYTLRDLEPPSADTMVLLNQILQEHGIPVYHY